MGRSADRPAGGGRQIGLTVGLHWTGNCSTTAAMSCEEGEAGEYGGGPIPGWEEVIMYRGCCDSYHNRRDLLSGGTIENILR